MVVWAPVVWNCTVTPRILLLFGGSQDFDGAPNLSKPPLNQWQMIAAQANGNTGDCSDLYSLGAASIATDPLLYIGKNNGVAMVVAGGWSVMVNADRIHAS